MEAQSNQVMLMVALHLVLVLARGVSDTVTVCVPFEYPDVGIWNVNVEILLPNEPAPFIAPDSSTTFQNPVGTVAGFPAFINAPLTVITAPLPGCTTAGDTSKAGMPLPSAW